MVSSVTSGREMVGLMQEETADVDIDWNTYLVTLIHLISMRYRKTVVFVQDYCLYVNLFLAILISFLGEGFG